MRKYVSVLLILALLLSGCTPAVKPGTDGTTEATQSAAVTTQPTTVATQPTTVPTLPTTIPTQPTTVPTAAPTQATTAATKPTSLHDPKHIILRYQTGTNVSDYDGGYEGKQFTTDGMKDGAIYAVDDGVIYMITEPYVTQWARGNGCVYFVLEDDARRVWRTDRNGNDRTLIYESEYGDVTFLNCMDRTTQEKLLIVENGNRCVMYNTFSKERNFLMEAYFVEQFYYDVSEQKISFHGFLNEKDAVSCDNFYCFYHYYLKTNEYFFYENRKNWVIVTKTES